MNVCPESGTISSELVYLFVTHLGILMHQYDEPECCLKRLICCLQSQGHSEGSFNQNMTVTTVSTEVLSFC